MTPKQLGFYARVVLSFASLSDALLVLFTKNILAKMTGNPDYASPTPALPDVSTALDNFSAAIQAAVNRDKLMIRARKQVRNTLLTLLRQLAAYVTCHCNGSVLTLQGSGFEAARVPQTVGDLLAPFGLTLSYTGTTGEIQYTFSKVANASNYTVQSAASPDGPWNDEGVSQTITNVLDGLTAGQVYWVHVCANGTAGPSPWTPAVSIMAV